MIANLMISSVLAGGLTTALAFAVTDETSSVGKVVVLAVGGLFCWVWALANAANMDDY